MFAISVNEFCAKSPKNACFIFFDIIYLIADKSPFVRGEMAELA